MKTGIVVFIAVFQSILLAAHFFVYETWQHFWNPNAASRLAGPMVVVVLLAVSFVAASLLSFRYWNSVTRVFYRASAVWLGLFNFLFLAALGIWLTWLMNKTFGLHWNERIMVVGGVASELMGAGGGELNAGVPS